MIESIHEARRYFLDFMQKVGYILEKQQPVNHGRQWYFKFFKDSWSYSYWLKYDREPFREPFKFIENFPREQAESLNERIFEEAKKKNCILVFVNPEIAYSIPWQQFEDTAYRYVQTHGEKVLVIPLSSLTVIFKLEREGSIVRGLH